MERRVYTVLQINRYIKGMLEDDYILASLWIKGEVSNYKKHGSGHIYFTLKDDKSAIDCIMFREYASMMPFELYNGLDVIVCGYISVYEKNGSYKFYVQIADPQGKGNLAAAFEELKARLETEGLFDPDYKREIEKRPDTVAVITSPTGAAVRDIIQVTGRRNPNVKIVVCPTVVQGDKAAESIAEAIKTVNEWGKADTIILGRGGGSAEDLWPFNEEIVARAIFASEIPVISAVGHETDFTISDFAADLRAPTPSAAAELAVNSLEEDAEIISARETRLVRAYRGCLHGKRLELSLAANKIALSRPDSRLEKKKSELNELKNRFKAAEATIINEEKAAFAVRLNRMEALSPLSILKRGYSVAYVGEDIIGMRPLLRQGTKYGFFRGREE